ncbi:hypothetical protein ACFE04_002664 [Oxalis oulophora]
MPRNKTLECIGCPSIRALTFDSLGLIKVTEARSKQGGVPKVVERWGELDSSKCVLAASIDDRKFNPLLAVARKNGVVEVLNPLTGDCCVSISNVEDGSTTPEDDAISGLHLFKTHNLEEASRWSLRKVHALQTITICSMNEAHRSVPLSVGDVRSPDDIFCRSCTLFTCTIKGSATMKSIKLSTLPGESAQVDILKTWKVSSSGSILCSRVDESEKYALFGGKGVEMNVWNLDQCTKIWTAKPPKKDSLGIFTPTWFTSAAFLNKDDHRKFVAGTNSHQVRLYDISSQRRHVLSFDYKEAPIKAIAEDSDGNTIFIGTGSGDLASFDIRTGKLLGGFFGKCCGSVRSISRHPELPVIASCGLDGYLRFWNTKSRQLLAAVYLKQHLTSVVLDSNFSDEEIVSNAEVPEPQNGQTVENDDSDKEDEECYEKKKKRRSKEREARKSKKSKSKKSRKRLDDSDSD